MNCPTLRPDQVEVVQRLRAAFKQHQRVLLNSPTGSGKTIMFSFITHNASARGNHTLILAHRRELIGQISRSLSMFDTPHGIIAPGYRPRARELVQVGSVFSVVRRLGYFHEPDLIVCDEAHHATNATTWGRVIKAFPRAKVLGVTATACRLSGEGLRDCFDTLVVGRSVQELVEIGALAPSRVFAPALVDTKGLHTRMGDFVKKELTARADTATVTGDAVAHYQRLASGRRAVVFCVSVEHAQHVAERFQSAGISAASVDGSMDRATRDRLVGDFTAGRTLILTSCDLVSEGFDCPGIEVAISLRPTQSEGLWLQQVGRALRPFPGKAEALILDHAGNTERHGLPDDDREWSLDGRAIRRRGSSDEKSPGVRICRTCFAALKAGTGVCTYCGTAWVPSPREVTEAEGELTEIDKAALRAKRKREEHRAETLEDLVALGRERGYNSPYGWAQVILKTRRQYRSRFAS